MSKSSQLKSCFTSTIATFQVAIQVRMPRINSSRKDPKNVLKDQGKQIKCTHGCDPVVNEVGEEHEVSSLSLNGGKKYWMISSHLPKPRWAELPHT